MKGSFMGFSLRPKVDFFYIRSRNAHLKGASCFMNVHIASGWKALLEPEFCQPYFEQIVQFLKSEISEGRRIFPPGSLIFNAFDKTPFDRIKVVILGQDPYHGPGQAQGLCFSVPDGQPFPPSLRNIFTELKQDLGLAVPGSGNLEPWTGRGVFLLNSILTVRAGEPASHSRIGWETFTDAVIRMISERKKGVVFLLWGKFACNKAALIDDRKHHILTASHPSPFSAERGFFGCRHFSLTNEWLLREGQDPVDWQLN